MLAHDVDPDSEIGVSFQLNLRPPHRADDDEIDRAVALAGEPDAAVVVVGTIEEVESEDSIAFRLEVGASSAVLPLAAEVTK